MNISLYNLNEVKCKFSNVKDVTEDIAMLKTKLDAEIMETYNHLRTEIDMEMGPYITHDGSENAYLNHKDGEHHEDHEEKDILLITLWITQYNKKGLNCLFSMRLSHYCIT